MEEDADASSTDYMCECGDPDCPGSVSYVYPFRLNAEYVGEGADGLVGYFSVRTSSSSWDGERTDLHDLLSLLLAMLLRVREIASVQLISELNAFSGIDSEIYSRLVVLRQEGLVASLKGRSYLELLSAQSHAAHDMVLDIFGIPAAGPRDWRDGEANYKIQPPWLDAVRKRLRLNTSEGWEFNHRKTLGTNVFTSISRGVSIAEIGADRIAKLRKWLINFRPASAEGMTRTSFRSDLLVNAVSNSRLKQAAALLAMIEAEKEPLAVIPFDSHFILIGMTTFVALADPCGFEAFHSERVATEMRRNAEAEVFLPDADVQWAESIDDVRFEALIGELLAQERGVLRIRQVGATREADDGRDFLAEWRLPPHGLTAAGITDGAPLLEQRDVIVQVKIRRQGVGRSHLPGLRDTMEHYRCTGLLVVAFPNVTTTLGDHLAELRRKGDYWIDWWGKVEIEQRVRRFPDIAARYRDLLMLRRS